MRKVLAIVASGVLWWSCGETPSRFGVLVNRPGVVKSMVGPSPADLASRDLVPGTLVRQKRADVLDAPGTEMLVDLGAGRGIEIRDAQGRTRRQIATAEYLTDFGAVPARGGAGAEIVLYTYPNRDGGGTFVVMTPEERELARWNEQPPAGRIDVSTWHGQSAIFYLQDDTLVVRSPRGVRLAALPASEGRHFRDIHVVDLAGPFTVALASGNAYSPYHMVCVYDAVGSLVFQEVGQEHAFELRADGAKAFIVSTRSTEWRYTLP